MSGSQRMARYMRKTCDEKGMKKGIRKEG